jgi:hypothetical protein
MGFRSPKLTVVLAAFFVPDVGLLVSTSVEDYTHGFTRA